MILATLAVFAFQQAAPSKAFEILGEGLPKANIAVTHVSRDGKRALAEGGGKLYTIDAEGMSVVKALNPSLWTFADIRNDGLILGYRGSQLLFCLRGEQRVVNIPVQRDGDQGIILETHFGADGMAYALFPGSIYRTMRVLDGDVVELFFSDGMSRIHDSTERGLLGETTFVVAQGATGPKGGIWRKGRLSVVYIDGNTVTRFELPPGTNSSGVTAWSDYGETVIGHADYANRPARVPVVWRQGRIHTLLYVGKEPANVMITGVTRDGKMAVGHRKPLRRDMAVIWREREGLEVVAEVAAKLKIEITEGWTLTDAVGVDSDGTILGTAKHPSKGLRPYRLRLTPQKPDTEGG